MKRFAMMRAALALVLLSLAMLKIFGGVQPNLLEGTAAAAETLGGVALFTARWRLGCVVGAVIPLVGMAIQAVAGPSPCRCFGPLASDATHLQLGVGAVIVAASAALLWCSPSRPTPSNRASARTIGPSR